MLNYENFLFCFSHCQSWKMGYTCDTVASHRLHPFDTLLNEVQAVWLKMSNFQSTDEQHFMSVMSPLQVYFINSIQKKLGYWQKRHPIILSILRVFILRKFQTIFFFDGLTNSCHPFSLERIPIIDFWGLESYSVRQKK